jgi:t-SNARE complex subunit (syntaxin)
VTIDRAIIEERDTEIRQLEREIVGLNEVFKDVAELVKEQGETITTIEDETLKAAHNVEEGVGQLRKASEYQKSSRSKLCCLALIATAIVAAVAVFCGVYFGVIKK